MNTKDFEWEEIKSTWILWVPYRSQLIRYCLVYLALSWFQPRKFYQKKILNKNGVIEWHYFQRSDFFTFQFIAQISKVCLTSDDATIRPLSFIPLWTTMDPQLLLWMTQCLADLKKSSKISKAVKKFAVITGCSSCKMDPCTVLTENVWAKI